MPDGAEGASPLGQWPHNLSSTLACLGCTVGLFNISRFAVLSVQFGGESVCFASARRPALLSASQTP